MTRRLAARGRSGPEGAHQACRPAAGQRRPEPDSRFGADGKGDARVVALEAAPAGVGIDPGTGLVTIATDGTLAAAPVTVRASNAATGRQVHGRVVADGEIAIGDES